MMRSFLTGYEARGDHTHARYEVLQKCLGDALRSMHALRCRVLLRAVDATIRGRRLTLIDLARSWPGAERIRAPLKALDRLLGNRHLHAGHQGIHAAMARRLARGKQPVIVVDWSELKQGRRSHLLRAAMSVGGRTLPILDRVFPHRSDRNSGSTRSRASGARHSCDDGRMRDRANSSTCFGAQ